MQPSFLRYTIGWCGTRIVFDMIYFNFVISLCRNQYPILYISIKCYSIVNDIIHKKRDSENKSYLFKRNKTL